MSPPTRAGTPPASGAPVRTVHVGHHQEAKANGTRHCGTAEVPGLAYAWAVLDHALGRIRPPSGEALTWLFIDLERWVARWRSDAPPPDGTYRPDELLTWAAKGMEFDDNDALAWVVLDLVDGLITWGGHDPDCCHNCDAFALQAAAA